MTHLTNFISKHRKAVIAAWIGLTVIGVVLSGRIVWNQSSSVPGQPAYEAGQKVLAASGAGVRSPNVLVFTGHGDIAAAIDRAAATMPGARVGGTYEKGDTTFALIYPPGRASWDRTSQAEQMANAASAPGLTVNVTGRDALDEASKQGESGGSVLVEALIGAVGALLVLLFVFGTLPAVLIPLAVALASIMNTFSLVWALSHIASVSVIVQFLIGLVGLGIAIDYALLVIVRFREELKTSDPDTALQRTMATAGRSVIVSGTTVAIGLLALVALPLPLVRSLGIGGMLIPAVSVLASLTLLPALLATLGTRINSIPVMPRRLLGNGGGWGRWARFVLRRPRASAAVGLVDRRRARRLRRAAERHRGAAEQLPRHRHRDRGPRPAGRGRHQPRRDEAAQRDRRRGRRREAARDPRHHRRQGRVARLRRGVPGRRRLARSSRCIDRAKAAGVTVTGIAAIDRDFVHVLKTRLPWVLALVIGLTFLLLVRAFRSIVLPLKAILLNLVSLAAAFGVVVIVFQLGHGSGLWDVPAAGSITPWVALMIFAFLFGLSMDYEVFMLSRMREAYDETGSTEQAIEIGLARTGKLVTSAALILGFAFLVLSTSPGYEIKPLAIGVAAGIVIDATVIRALLVPALMRLMGDANWWMPFRSARVLGERRVPVVADVA